VYKKITLKTESAFKLLGITFSATADDAKKAYKEKLKLFHPDHYDSNKVMQQIASKKTHQIVEAYRTVLDFLSE
ncbi:MAG: DnaJ domain-containing protein, partial [Treponema sp.]|nr:DnaJ domain-containing protein [Treponema sp.]